MKKILKPDDDDQSESKKPRFRQDLAVLIVVVSGVLIYLLLELLGI